MSRYLDTEKFLTSEIVHRSILIGKNSLNTKCILVSLSNVFGNEKRINLI